MYEEKRKFKRVAIKVIANFIWDKSETCVLKNSLSFSQDLSFSGAHLIISDEVKIGERVALVLEIPIYFIPILIYGEVIWVRDSSILRHKTKNRLEMGVKFLKVDEFDRKRIIGFIHFKSGYSEN